MKRKGINFNISKTLTFFTPTPEQIADLQEQGFLPGAGPTCPTSASAAKEKVLWVEGGRVYSAPL